MLPDQDNKCNVSLWGKDLVAVLLSNWEFSNLGFLRSDTTPLYAQHASGPLPMTPMGPVGVTNVNVKL